MDELREPDPEDLSSLEDLEWGLLLSKIGDRTAGPLGRARVVSLEMPRDREQSALRLSVMEESLRIAREGDVIPGRAVADIRPSLGRLEKGGVLGVEELCAVVGVLRAAEQVLRFGVNHAERAPLLARVLSIEEELLPLRSELGRMLGEDGEVLDEASPQLRSLRQRVQVLRKRVQARIGELINAYRDALQDGFYAEREGRYVLPVRSDAPYRVSGMVLGTSQSGSTLYVEPSELGPLANDLRMAEAEVEREVARILAEISRRLQPLVEPLADALDVCIRADLLQAITRFGLDVDGIIVPFAPDGELEVVGGRHPLLSLDLPQVVPQDAHLSSGKVLVVSGPNAGGKTVLLKMLGLFALMQRAGLPIPAEEGTKIAFFDRVFSDVGDDQSLSMSLSTFSGHVEKMADFLSAAAPSVLILVDELMSGTDPREGAALAVAYLEEATQRGATLLVTTHYEELKLHAQDHERFDNAAVGFDFENMRPTFTLEQGRPGASSALVVAGQHRLIQSVTERARELLPELFRRQREEQLDLERLRAQAAREQKELEFELERQRVITLRLKEEYEQAKEERRRAVSLESDELRRSLQVARANLARLTKEMGQAKSTVALKEMREEIDAAAAKVSIGSEAELAARKQAARPPSKDWLKLGLKVRVLGLSTPAEVLSWESRGQVRVKSGAMKLTVKASDLSPWDGKVQPLPQKPLPRAPALASPPREREALLKTDDVTVDLRGERVEPALARVDGFLDDLLLRREPGGYILHGHGTGAMKEAVRAHLSGHSAVDYFRAAERAEGGDAFTLVWVRDSPA